MSDSPKRRVFVDTDGNRVEIVPAVTANFDGVVRMYQEYPTTHRSHGLPPVGDDELEAWLTSLENDGQGFVALLDDEVVGHAAYAPVTVDTPDFVVFVDPDYQNRGIGTALLYHVVQNAAVEGFESIESYVDRDNESAIHVYEKIGFEDVEREPLVVRMQLDLTDFSSDVAGNFDEIIDE